MLWPEFGIPALAIPKIGLLGAQGLHGAVAENLARLRHETRHTSEGDAGKEADAEVGEQGPDPAPADIVERGAGLEAAAEAANQGAAVS